MVDSRRLTSAVIVHAGAFFLAVLALGNRTPQVTARLPERAEAVKKPVAVEMSRGSRLSLPLLIERSQEAELVPSPFAPVKFQP